MDFKEKYVSISEKDKPHNEKKLVLTDFEYAFLEALNKIADNIRSK